MQMPGMGTLRTLEERKNYLIRKLKYNLEDNTERKSYLIKEMRDVENAINFITWVMNNNSKDMVQRTVEEYTREKSNKTEEETAFEEDKKEEGIIYGRFGETCTRNNRYRIILSRNNGINYIAVESYRRKEGYPEVSWERTGKIKIPLQRMEKILRKADDINNEKSKTTSPNRTVYAAPPDGGLAPVLPAQNLIRLSGGTAADAGR